MSGPARDGYQPGQSSVQANQQVNPPEHQPGQRQRGDYPGGGRQIGVHQHVAHGYSIEGQNRGLAETPPLNPNQPNQRTNTPSVTRTTLDGGVVLAEPSLRNLPSRGPTTNAPARAAPASGAVDDGGSRKVLETHLGQPTAAPSP